MNDVEKRLQEKSILRQSAREHLAEARRKFKKGTTYADFCGVQLHIDQAKAAIRSLMDLQVFEEIQETQNAKT